MTDTNNCEMFDLCGRSFKVTVESQSARSHPREAVAVLSVLEGDQFRPLHERALLYGPIGDDVGIRRAAHDRAKQFCVAEGDPTIRFRCSRQHDPVNTGKIPSGSAIEVWDSNTMFLCHQCGSEHRIFVR